MNNKNNKNNKPLTSEEIARRRRVIKAKARARAVRQQRVEKRIATLAGYTAMTGLSFGFFGIAGAVTVNSVLAYKYFVKGEENPVLKVFEPVES